MMKKFVKIMMLLCAAVAVASCSTEEIEPGLAAPELKLFGAINGSEQAITEGAMILTPADSKGYALTIKSNDWWTASIACEGGTEWATIASNESVGGASSTTINISFADNTDFETRTAMVTVSTEPTFYTGAVAKLSFKLVQTGANAFVVADVDEAEGLPFGFAADLDTTFKVASNTKVTTSVVYPEDDPAFSNPEEGWLEVSPEQVDEGTDQVVTVKTLKINGTGADREAIVRLTTEEKNGTQDVYDVHVTQAFLVQKIEAAQEIPAEGVNVGPFEGYKDSVEVAANVPFKVSVEYDDADQDKTWLAVSDEEFAPTTPGEASNVMVRFQTAKNNTSGDARAAHLVFTSTGSYGEAAELFRVKVVQKYEAPTITLAEGSETTVKLGLLGGVSDTVEVNSNVKFSAAVTYEGSETGWLELGTTEFEAGNGIKIGFKTLSDNLSGNDRSAKLTLSTAPEFGEPDTKEVTVTQIGEMTPISFVNKDKFNGDSLYVAWTGDAAYSKYNVVVAKKDNPSEVLATLEVAQPAGADNTTVLSANIGKEKAVTDFVGTVTAKVVPVWSTGTEHTANTSESVEMHTTFADGTGDGSGVGSEILLANVRHLLNVKDMAAYYKLSADVDMTSWAAVEDNKFTPIGQKDAPFTGSFDGDGKTITALKLRNNNAGSGSTGLFGHIKSPATVKNFTVSDPDLVMHTPVTSENNAPHSFDKTLGHSIVVGYNDGATIEKVNVVVLKELQFASGGLNGVIAGVNTNTATISDCHVTGSGSITANSGKNGGTALGGIVGINYGNETGDKNTKPDYSKMGVVERCSNAVEVIGRSQGTGNYANMAGFGGIAGFSDGMIESCYNTGDVTSGSTNVIVGGLVGGTIAGELTDVSKSCMAYNQTFASEIRKSFNSGTVTALGTSRGTGGLVGDFGIAGAGGRNGNAVIRECYNTGTVQCTKSGGGAIVGGLIGLGHRANIYDSYVQANVTSSGNAEGGTVYVGGLIGEVSTLATVNRAYVVGNVDVATDGTTATKCAGAFYGRINPGNNKYSMHNYAYANKDMLPAVKLVEGAGNSYLVLIGRFCGFACNADGNGMDKFINATKPLETGFQEMAPWYTDRTTITPNSDILSLDNIESYFLKTEAEMKTADMWETFATDTWNVSGGSYPTLKNVVTPN